MQGGSRGTCLASLRTGMPLGTLPTPLSWRTPRPSSPQAAPRLHPGGYCCTWEGPEPPGDRPQVHPEGEPAPEAGPQRGYTHPPPPNSQGPATPHPQVRSISHPRAQCPRRPPAHPSAASGSGFPSSGELGLSPRKTPRSAPPPPCPPSPCPPGPALDDPSPTPPPGGHPGPPPSCCRSPATPLTQALPSA